jgi:hypothetical protein
VQEAAAAAQVLLVARDLQVLVRVLAGQVVLVHLFQLQVLRLHMVAVVEQMAETLMVQVVLVAVVRHVQTELLI